MPFNKDCYRKSMIQIFTYVKICKYNLLDKNKVLNILVYKLHIKNLIYMLDSQIKVIIK